MNQEFDMNSTYIIQMNDSIEAFRHLTGNFVIPGLGASGFFLNLIGFVVIQKLINTKNYKFIQAKIFTDMIICLLVCGFQDSVCSYCTSYNVNTYFAHFYRIYFLRVQVQTLYLTSNICELSIAFHRFCLTNGSTNWYTRADVKLIYFIAVFSSFLLNLPDYFSYDIVHYKQDLYILKLSDFAHSKFYSYFLAFVMFSHNIFSVFLMIILYVYILKAFKILKKKNSEKLIQNYYSVQKKLISMVLTLNIIFLIGRFSVFGGTLLMRLDALNNLLYNPTTVIYRSCYYILNTFFLGLNPLIIWLFDKKVRQCFKRVALEYLTVNYK